MKGIHAVIFDMDGVLIDSEPLWRTAMIKGFTGIGIGFTEEDCRKTTGMRFNEVVKHWFSHHEIKNHSSEELHDSVIKHLIDLIYSQGSAMSGAIETLNFFQSNTLPLGLATSSSLNIVDAVMNKIDARNFFKSIVSAENLKYGKPHPEVFLTCAEELKIRPGNCLVIEDSVNGVISAKAAGMKVIAVPDIEHKGDKRFAIADYQLNNLQDIIKLF